MSDDPRLTLERIARRVPVPEPAYDRLFRRKDHKQRVRRISAALVAILICLATVSVLLHGFGGAALPARPPEDIFSGLGGWIAYGFDPGAGPVGIYAVDPITRDIVQLSPHGGRPVAWSSDGSKLLILRTDLSPRGVYRGATLFVLGADGSETTLVRADVDHGIDGGSFSPDGSQVVYASSDVNSGQGGIFEIDASGGTPRLLRAGSGQIFPEFSPDGSTIAYLEGGGDHDNTLRLMDADGTNVRVILPDRGVMRGAVNGGLAWSPDGSELAFGSGYTPDMIWTVKADGTGLRSVIRQAKLPSWSPDGTQIAYANMAKIIESNRLAIANADGSNERSLSFAAPGPWNPLPRSSNPPSGTAP